MNVVLSLPECTRAVSVTVLMDNIAEQHVQVVAFDPKEIAEMDFEWCENPNGVERIKE